GRLGPPRCRVPEDLPDDPAPLHPGDGVFDAGAPLRWLAAGALLGRRQAAPPRLFFRPAGLRHRRLIPLDPRALRPGGTGRVSPVLLAGDPLVVGRPGVRPAREQEPPARGAGDGRGLARVRLLLAAVVPGLSCGAFRPLPPPPG